MDVPSIGDRAAIDRFRASLDAAGFNAGRIAEAMGDSATDIAGGVVKRVRARQLPQTEPLSVLVRLFLMGDAIPIADVETHLEVDNLVAIGVLAREANLVRSRMRLVAVGELLIAGEPDDVDDVREDRVPSVHSASTALADLTVRRDAALALDIGTGCGVQAMLAATHSHRVIGADLNPRALGFSRFNAELNGVSNASFVQASFFEPFAEGAFDLVVANPPFVISPDQDYLFRDAGTRGEELSRDVVRGAAAALAEGGFASVLCNWTADDEARWWERGSGWLEGLGCDAWILQAMVEDPVAYAASFNAGLAANAGQFEQTVSRWADWFAAAGIRHIAIGAFVLRKRNRAENWLRVASLVEQARGSGGEHLLRMFAGVDAVAEMQPAEILRSSFAPLEGNRVEETISFESAGYRPGRTYVHGSLGLGIQVVIDPHVLPALFVCDGKRSLAECVRHAEQQVGIRKGDLERPAIDAMKALTEAGYFHPTSRGSRRPSSE